MGALKFKQIGRTYALGFALIHINRQTGKAAPTPCNRSSMGTDQDAFKTCLGHGKKR